MPIKTTMRHYLTLVRMSIIKKQALTSASENVEKREAQGTAGEKAYWYNYYEEQYRGSSKN